MTEPNLDEQVSDFMASLFIKHRVYHAEPDPAVVAEWVEFIANQVREARIDEIKMLQTQATGYGSDPSYTKYPFYVIEQHAINDRIKELGE